MSNSRKLLVIFGVVLIFAGLFIRSQRVALAQEFGQARILLGMPLTQEDAMKVAVVGLTGSLTLASGVVTGLVGLLRKDPHSTPG